MSKKLSKNVLAKIKKDNISPREKWIFLAKNYGMWALAVVGIILAGIFVGNVIHEVMLGEWDIMHRFPGGQAHFLLQAIPFLWLLGLMAAFAFAYFLLRKTKRGYRFGMLAISGGIFVVSSVFGVALLSTPLPPKLREVRMEHFPPRFEQQRWMNPEQGFLFGEILSVDDQLFLLNAIDESVWEVDISEARIPPHLELDESLRVRVIGEDLGENTFLAEFVKEGDLREMKLKKMFQSRGQKGMMQERGKPVHFFEREQGVE